MFMIIDTKGATGILVNVPAQGAATSLPKLVELFEHNAVFINKGWREIKTVRPSISIQLGNSYEALDSEDQHVIVVDGPLTIDADYEIATPEVFTRNTQQLKKKNEEIESLNRKLKYTEEMLADANRKILALTNPSADSV